MRLLRLWLALAGLSAGVLLGYAHPGPRLALALCGLGVTTLIVRRKPLLLLVGVVVAACGAGALDASLRTAQSAAVSVLASDFAHCQITGRVLEDQGALGTLVAILHAGCDGYAPISDPGTVMFPTRVADPGATVSASGTLVPLREDPFDLARRRAGASGLFDPDSSRTTPATSLPLHLASAIRNGLLNATQSLQPPRRGLVRGLTIGDTSDIDAVTVDDFRRAGLSHLLAVSGENLAMFLGALAFAIRRLPYRLRLLAYFGAIGLFVLVVGPQPSVLRAAVMGAVMVAAVGRGHRAQPLAVLATALIVVIAFRPGLVFSVGLQLSAAATSGIVLWTKPVERALRKLPRAIALPLAVTISAQVAVAPILIATFGQLSLISPVANLVAFPAVAPPTVLGLCAGVVSLISIPAARILAALAGPFAGWIAWVGTSLGAAPGAAVDLPKGAAYLAAIPALAAAVTAAARTSE
ncbi:MAG: competence protein ComEC [Actinomycetota bacterium]|nr:competence protein ComEC [Actinomycetota bacterium]